MGSPDIAVLELKKKVNLKKSGANPVCLPTKKTNHDNADAIVAGWGATENQVSINLFTYNGNMIDTFAFQRLDFEEKN